MTPVLPALRRGDAIRVDMDKPSRPAVILDVRGDVVAYTWGTGTQRSWLKHVCIGMDTRAGKAMRLDKDTYFYARNVEIIRTDVLAIRFRRKSGRCPPEDFLQIAEMTEPEIQARVVTGALALVQALMRFLRP